MDRRRTVANSHWRLRENQEDRAVFLGRGIPETKSRLESSAAKPEAQRVRWKKITLVGVGLLGGSLGIALRKRRLAESVVGFVRRAASVAECEALGAVHFATRDLPLAVEGAELVVLCPPIAQMRPLVEQMLPALRHGAI